MDVKKHKRRASFDEHDVSLPYDIIESILSRLPVKSLLRFKSVCKQWSATISDPKFSETHLRSTTWSSYIKACECEVLFGGRRDFTRICLENDDEFRQLPNIENQPPDLGYRRVWYCHCDGLYLSCHSQSRGGGRGRDTTLYFDHSLCLWNPSSRTLRELRCPYPLDLLRRLNCGICYDPLVKDYKVVVADANYYAVYYCNTNSWSELKEMNITLKISCYNNGGGSIYWVSYSCLEQQDRKRHGIVCFDGRDEKWRSFHIVDRGGGRGKSGNFISSRDCLYFIPIIGLADRVKEMMIMKKVGDDDDDSWMELKLNLHPFYPAYVHAICCTQDDKIIINTLGQFLLCDTTKNSATRIQNTTEVGPNRYLFPYKENLFLL